MCTYHILFIYLSVDGHSGCFHLGAILKNAAVNIGVRYLFKFLCSVLSGINLGVESWDYVTIQCLAF